MRGTTKILLVALAAGLLGVAAGIVFQRPGAGPLFSTELGQRALQGALSATAPAVPEGVNVAERGDIVSEFSLPDLQGTPIGVPSAWTGRPVLVNVWASWCGPCRFEFPYLQQVAARYGKQVGFLGVDSQDSNDAAGTFLSEAPVPYPSYTDPDQKIAESVGAGRGLPDTAFYDRRGRLVHLKQGPYDSRAELQADVEAYALRGNGAAESG
jgi:thiol-disulfide isomerase/thioredoxin